MASYGWGNARTTASNFTQRDYDLRMKKQALNQHLVLSEARKNDYKFVKGIGRKQDDSHSYKANATLKYTSRDFEQMAVKSISNGNDIGSQTIGASYEVMKNTARLMGVNEKLLKGTVKATGKTIKIGEKAYNVGKNIYGACMTGTLSGTLNMYKNITMIKGAKALRYSKTLYHTRNVFDKGKTLVLKSQYRYNATVKLVKGVRNGSIIITAKDMRNLAGRGALRVGKGVNKLAHTKGMKGMVRAGGNAVKSLGGNGDDMGTKSISTSVDTLRYSGRMLKMTGKALKKGRNAVKSTKRFVKLSRKFGFKNISNKTTKKLRDKAIKMLSKLLFNPVAIGGIVLFLSTGGVISAGVTAASSTVGGVVDWVQDVWEDVKGVAKDTWDFVCDAAGAVVDFFSFGDGGEPPRTMTYPEIVYYLVQIFKTNYVGELEIRRNELVDVEGYHEVLYINTMGDDIEVSDIHNPDKGLMSDESYTRAISPVFKSIILGTMGTKSTEDTSDEILIVFKECFDTLTVKEEIPYVDLNGDGIGDYNYCDGSFSLNEKENVVYTHIGGVLQDGIFMETGECYNNSGTLYHASHNTEGLACCKTLYFCGSHYIYYCKGHGVTTFCDDIDVCTNKGTTTTYCSGEADCTNRGGYSTPSGIQYFCKGHSTVSCLGHSTTSYCWSGGASSYGSCDNYISQNYRCYYGYSETSHSDCNNEQSSFSCTGYNLCYGHRLMKFMIGNNGFEDLLNSKFVNRINELKSKGGSLTDSEKEELANLETYYEFALGCYEYSDPITDEFFETLNKETE